MDTLEKEILKYEKKGFKKDQKKTLKFGLRMYLVKKNNFLTDDEGVYIYYINGEATIDSMREFFKDYVKFFDEKNFTSSDRGLYLVAGNIDEKLFRDLRKAMVEEDEVRNSIKLVKTDGSIKPEVIPESKAKNESHTSKNPSLTHDETERIIHRVGTMCCYPHCSETIALDVHHIIPRKEGGSDKDTNLVVLCPTHHRSADRGAIPRKRLELYSVAKMEEKRL